MNKVEKIDKFFVASQWLIRFVWANLVWLFLIIIGLGIFGFMPATAALFAVTRKWSQKDIDIAIWPTAWKAYKKAFLETNIAGLCFAGILGFLYVDLRIVFATMNGLVSSLLYFFLFFLFAMTLLALVNYFSVYVHFIYPLRGYLMQSFLLAFTSWKTSLLLIAGFGVAVYLIAQVPALVLFISGVLPAYWVMKVNLIRFQKMQAKMTAQSAESVA
ncbi:YesL family protein [Listeria booriae]|uniref:YesL family protein n=1 Tax=Listeria booriae TaxID=1552123 RepID=UPI0016245793|nr:YesL family protein [Listeria booriae]MBC2188046.1 YesL family protein [Listeria booriae]